MEFEKINRAEGLKDWNTKETGFLYARAAEMLQTLYRMQKERASQKVSWQFGS